MAGGAVRPECAMLGECPKRVGSEIEGATEPYEAVLGSVRRAP